MGTKRKLAPLVADVVSNAPAGPLLDLFSGICAVGAEVAPKRPVWSNDVQHFASNVARAFFTSKDYPIEESTAADLAYPYYRKNLDLLSESNREILEYEQLALQSKDFHKIANISKKALDTSTSAKLERERTKYSKSNFRYPYKLFTITFPSGYLSIAQCTQVDSIRYAIDQIKENRTITADQHRWMLLALCQAVSKCSTTTGHFAQFLKVKESNLLPYLNHRGKSVWLEWLKSMNGFAPIDTSHWRSKNKVFRNNAISLLNYLKYSDQIPAVIYADPPYTADQYSRYYHLYETLILYDYPQVQAIGKYRPDRYRSDFSLKTNVYKSIEGLISKTASMGSQLVMSYPDNGLLTDARETIIEMCSTYFDNVSLTHELDHQHSSLGASKGTQQYPVTELIFWAK